MELCDYHQQQSNALVITEPTVPLPNSVPPWVWDVNAPPVVLTLEGRDELGTAIIESP